MIAAVYVRAPCRLHFGMFSFGHADRAEFGGVGLMVEPPSVEVDILRSDGFGVRGSLSERVLYLVDELVKHWKLETRPKCSIEVRSPPDHSGLGVGTQLGLALAAGMRRFLQLPELSIESLAGSAGRGGRSAVGTYGFGRGGLIIDAGKLRGETLGKLHQRLEVPSDWRFVLVRTTSGQGLAGAHEAAAFAMLPPVSETTTRKLWQIVTENLLPALKAGDCAAFGEAIYAFGWRAGERFAMAQSGVFATPTIERLVNAIRQFGVTGVGQSSWGPTVFAIVPCERDAGRLIEWLHDHPAARDCEIMVATPNNTGAQISG